MMRLSILAILFSICIALPAPLTAGTLENQGKEWLDAQKNPSALNVTGDWDSEFGNLHLSQTNGYRDVSGIGGGYTLTGVVSGKSLFLLFSMGDTVNYCATVHYDSDSGMIGTYSNRVSRLHGKNGLCQGQNKSRPIYMKKK